MAKKKKRIKLLEEDIHKNSGKEISHTISKIKEHEKLYTFILVIVFMITISLSVFIGLSVDKYKLYDMNYYSSGFSMSGQLVALSAANIMSDEEGLKSEIYNISYENNTANHINYLLRFTEDENTIEKCDCRDNILSFHNLKYSIDGKTVQQFTDETMILSTGMIPSQESDSLKVRLWIDNSISDSECLYYGKFVVEEIEDMDD